MIGASPSVNGGKLGMFTNGGLKVRCAVLTVVFAIEKRGRGRLMVVRVRWVMSTVRIGIVVVIVVMFGTVTVMTVRGGSGTVKRAEAKDAPRKVQRMARGKRISKDGRVDRRLWCGAVMAYR